MAYELPTGSRPPGRSAQANFSSVAGRLSDRVGVRLPVTV
jgi:hypothetical protein